MSSPAGSAVTETRHEFAAGVIGGSATVIDYGHTRLVSDPVFSPPGQQGPLTKITGPAAAARLGPRARGIPWGSHTTLPRGDGHGVITVHAVEAVHGPLDGETDPATGAVNAQTTGFVLLRHAFDAGAVGLLALAPLGTWTLTAAPVTRPEASS